MTVASKTLLQQMRFTRCGAPFCSIAAKTTIDAQNFDFYDRGGSFYGPANDTTPYYDVYAANPVRQGNSFKWLNAKSSIDSNYGRVTQGQPFYIQSDTHTYPVYASNPVRQGTAFLEITAKDTIDASSDFYRQGQPFYIYYGGPPPEIIFDPTRMFLIF